VLITCGPRRTKVLLKNTRIGSAPKKSVELGSHLGGKKRIKKKKTSRSSPARKPGLFMATTKKGSPLSEKGGEEEGGEKSSVRCDGKKRFSTWEGYRMQIARERESRWPITWEEKRGGEGKLKYFRGTNRQKLAGASGSKLVFMWKNVKSLQLRPDKKGRKKKGRGVKSDIFQFGGGESGLKSARKNASPNHSKKGITVKPLKRSSGGVEPAQSKKKKQFWVNPRLQKEGFTPPHGGKGGKKKRQFALFFQTHPVLSGGKKKQFFPQRKKKKTHHLQGGRIGGSGESPARKENSSPAKKKEDPVFSKSQNSTWNKKKRRLRMSTKSPAGILK